MAESMGSPAVGELNLVNPVTVEITDGTNTANILKSDGTAAGQNAQIVAGGGMTTPTLTLNSGSPNTQWFDMLNYAWVSVEILTNTTPATLAFQTSGDASETNVTNTALSPAANQGSGGQVMATSTSSANGTFHGPRTGRYFRISSNNGAGTTTLVLTFHTIPSALPIGQSQTVGSNSATGSAVPANAFYVAGKDSNGNLVGILSGSSGDGQGSSGMIQAVSVVYNGSTYDRMRSGGVTGAAMVSGDTATGSAVPGHAFYIGSQANNGNLTGLYVSDIGDSQSGIKILATGLFGYNGDTSWSRLRTPVKFNTAQATASGDTAVWTPTSGKKFRIMRFKVQVTGNAATSGGGVITIKLRDSTTDMNLTHDVYVPSIAATSLVADYDSGWIDLGNGFLSAAANNVLNVNLSAAITTGNVRVITAGTEE